MRWCLLIHECLTVSWPLCCVPPVSSACWSCWDAFDESSRCPQIGQICSVVSCQFGSNCTCFVLCLFCQVFPFLVVGFSTSALFFYLFVCFLQFALDCSLLHRGWAVHCKTFPSNSSLDPLNTSDLRTRCSWDIAQCALEAKATPQFRTPASLPISTLALALRSFLKILAAVSTLGSPWLTGLIA